MKGLLIFFLGIFTLSIFSCRNDGKKTKAVDDVQISGNYLDTSRYAIILKDTSMEISKDEMQLIYSVIKKAVDSVKLRRGNDIDTSRYKFQIVPLKSTNRQRLFWINAFCNDDTPNWRKELYQVKDGGKCFFNTTINLSTLTYSNLVVNGEA